MVITVPSSIIDVIVLILNSSIQQNLNNYITDKNDTVCHLGYQCAAEYCLDIAIIVLILNLPVYKFKQ